MEKLPGPPLEKLFPDVEVIDGEKYRYHVHSRSGGKPHLVDLCEYGFNGQCDCEDFRFRCEPKLSRGIPVDQSLRCRHLKLAHAYFGAISLRAIWCIEQGRRKDKKARVEPVRRVEPPKRVEPPSRRNYQLDRNKTYNR